MLYKMCDQLPVYVVMKADLFQNWQKKKDVWVNISNFSESTFFVVSMGQDIFDVGIRMEINYIWFTELIKSTAIDEQTLYQQIMFPDEGVKGS